MQKSALASVAFLTHILPVVSRNDCYWPILSQARINNSALRNFLLASGFALLAPG
jgi:hypothetical protein